MKEPLPDYYRILGVPEDAEEDLIHAAYRIKAKKLHPDKQGGNNNSMMLLNAARDTLTDPAQRAAYDELRKSKSTPPPPPPPPPGETPAWARRVGHLLDELGEEGEAAAVEVVREGVRAGVGRLKGLFRRGS